jgi:hypothetical protein
MATRTALRHRVLAVGESLRICTIHLANPALAPPPRTLNSALPRPDARLTRVVRT